MYWYVAMRPGKRKELDKANSPVDALMDKVEKLKASIRAKVEHPFRVIKRQFGYVKVRYRGWSMSTILTARRQLSWPVEAGNDVFCLCC